MATVMRVTSVWQYDDSAFTFEDSETGAPVTMQPINIGFDDDSLGVVYAPMDKAVEYMAALQLTEGCEAEFTLEVPAKPKTASGKQKWKVKDFPGKSRKSGLKILSDVPGDASPGTTGTAAQPSPTGGGEPPSDPAALSSAPTVEELRAALAAAEASGGGASAFGEGQEAPPSEDTRDPNGIADDSDWAYARDVFACGVNAPILVALALDGWSGEKPPSEENVTRSTLDSLIEKRLAGGI